MTFTTFLCRLQSSLLLSSHIPLYTYTHIHTYMYKIPKFFLELKLTLSKDREHYFFVFFFYMYNFFRTFFRNVDNHREKKKPKENTKTILSDDRFKPRISRTAGSQWVSHRFLSVSDRLAAALPDKRAYAVSPVFRTSLCSRDRRCRTTAT